jgi:hypothetical protein
MFTQEENDATTLVSLGSVAGISRITYAFVVYEVSRS